MGDSYYPFYPGDYARDTADLSMLEHGAYRLLLDFYYSEEKLPSDRQRLYRIARANNRHERLAVDQVVERFFCPSEARSGMLFGRRVERELAKRRAFALIQSEKGKKSGEARRTGVQPGLNRGATGQGTEGGTEGQPKLNQPSPSPEPERSKDTYPAADASGHELSLTEAEHPGKGNGGLTPKKASRTRKKSSEYPPDALELWQAYCDTIVKVPAKKADALRNIIARLKEGYTIRQLGIAMENYSDVMPEDPDRRYHPNNFFGQKAYYLGFLPEAEGKVAEVAARE